MSAATCARCGAPRTAGPECPSCGVIYERAERRASRVAAEPPETAQRAAVATPPRGPSAAALFSKSETLADARMELLLAKVAVPAALLACFVLVKTGMGHFLLRTFCSMWLHELGHAAAAWLCGFPAFPGPWITPIAEERSLMFGLALAGGAGYGAWRSFELQNRTLAAAAIAFLLAQFFCSVILRYQTAQVFITWAGDAGAMVFGVALMSAFFVPPEHKLHRDWLRWGFLVIGAAGFVDVFHEWWVARGDWSTIAFGEQSNAGPTDPSKLAMWGWTVPMLINRYLAVGVASLLVLIPLQLLHIRRTAAAVAALEGRR